MKELLSSSVYFGVLASLAAYVLGSALRRKFRLAIFNPLLLSVIFVIALLLISGVDYADYYAGARYLSYLLTPATVCLAIPLYEQLTLLKRHMKAILLGILSGVLTSLLCVLLLSCLLGLGHAEYVTLLPKSITTAIGMAVSEKLGGYATITVAVILITGVLGNIIAGGFLRLIRVEEPVARGIAIGSSAHAIGTARALEMGQIEGAMSSLSIVVSGLMTVIGASVFAQFL